MKQIDLGGMSFIELRENDMYYVDKTLLIRDILMMNRFGVYLFARPRRFGKTTNLSMLDAFFNRSFDSRIWFDGLAITKYPECMEQMNKYPVIHLDLGGTKAETKKEYLEKMRNAMALCFEPHRYLLESDKLRAPVRKIFETLDDGSITEARLKTAVQWLSLALSNEFGVKPVILIDEYDAAVSDAFGTKSHEPMMKFLKDLMYSTVKGNPYRGMVYITGVMQIAKASIFSDLNNVSVFNIFSEMGDERFGFTESEVKKALKDYRHSNKFDEAKKWYDGYRFGNAEVYNPFSIMNYISSGCKAEPYWISSGSTNIISDLLWNVDSDNIDKVIGLVTGGSVETDLASELAYDEVMDKDEYLYSLMAMSGYLKAVPLENGKFKVSIPNEEVRLKVDKMVSSVGRVDTKYFKGFIQATIDGDAAEMEEYFQDVLLHGNYLNLKENAYEVIMMTLMHSLIGRYHVRTEHKGGFGRTDIVLEPKTKGEQYRVFELKVSKTARKLDKDAHEAIGQIHEEQYYFGMPGDVMLYGISFYGNQLKVLTETVHNDEKGRPLKK